MATTIRSLITKIMLLGMEGRTRAGMDTLPFDTIRLAFSQEEDAILEHFVSAQQRMDYVEDFIDRHLLDTDPGPGWLAARLGVSLRRLQEDFKAADITLSAVIREKRLQLARQTLRSSRSRTGARTRISQVAFDCAFNDISYFNRSFRDRFGLTPSEFLRQEVDS